LLEAIDRAIAHSPEIIALQGALNATAAAVSVGRALRDPELRLSYAEDDAKVDHSRRSIENTPSPSSSTTVGHVNDEQSSYSVAVRFFPPNPWTWSPLVSQEEAAFKAAEAELEDAKRQISADLRLLFARIHHLTHDSDLMGRLVDLYAEKQEQVDRLTDSGVLSTMDSIAFSRRYLGAVSDRARTDMQRDELLQQLAGAVCLPADGIMLTTNANAPARIDMSATAEADFQALMMSNRTDIAALAWRRVAAEAAYRAHRRSSIPWFQHFQVSYQSSRGTSVGHDVTTEQSGPTGTPSLQDDYRDDRGEGDEWAVATAVNIPIFGAPDPRRDALMAGWRRARAQESAGMARAESQLRDACQAIRKLDAARARHHDRTLPIVRRIRGALASVNADSHLAFQEQVRMHEELIDAERLGLEADFRYHTAIIRLDTATGLPLASFPNHD